jgi:transaldolase
VTTSRRAVFFDRDGVLNEAVARDGKPYPPSSVEELVLTPGAREAVDRLRKAGFVTICVTNQPDVARGSLERSVADTMNRFVAEALGLDDLVACFHDDSDGCPCRKPRPGMLLDAADRWSISLKDSYVIGDRWRDIDAGINAGCYTVLVDRGWAERPSAYEPNARATSALTAANWVVDHTRSEMAKTSTEADSPEPRLDNLRIKLFADGADRDDIVRLAGNPLIAGFTTNPTLMRKAAVSDYELFARSILEIIGSRPVSYEVFADDFPEMRRQALKITTWGENVYVKIPVTNTLAKSSAPLVRELSEEGVKLNVTALMTDRQVESVTAALAASPGAYISVFAGRIADTGRDPVPIMARSVDIMRSNSKLELIWASPRELLNIFQADAAGVHVITGTHDILVKLHLVAKNLDDFSLDTVKMFHRDAAAAGFKL